MIEQVYEKIYRCEVPLPNNPLKSLNSYIIKGKEKTIIIDTGFNSKVCKDAFYDNLKELDVDIKKSEIIITHLHADHSGLAHELYNQGAKILMSGGDGRAAKALSQDENWIDIRTQLESFGIEVGEGFFDTHPGKLYGPSGEFEFDSIKEGDIIEVDGYRFEVVSVPGHTPDMISLYESNHKIYFSGDHVLDPITPNIGFWGFEYPVILGQYISSLKKIYAMDIKLMLPAHRKLILDHQRRIDELLSHHDERLEEIENILTQRGKEMTVEEIAREMTWKISANTWDGFPSPQKFFALGEAMSHLEYLEHQNRVKMKKSNGILYFSI